MKLIDNTGLSYLIGKIKTMIGLKADKTYVDNKVKTDVPENAVFTDTIYTHPSTHPYTMITGTPTKLPADGGNADTSRHLIGDDTRNVNSNPSEYMSGGSRFVARAGWQTEFKSLSTMGLTELFTGGYCYLQTHTPWSDPTGGYPIQIAYGNRIPCWRVGISTTTWSAWQRLSDGGNANTVNGFTVGVNVPSNAKFTDMVTTINGKTGAISKADIVALGIPAQDTVVDISGKVDKVVGKGLSTEDYTTAEKTKLAGVATGANKYTHPANHPPSIITQDANNRFVTDTEKAAWSGKADKTYVDNKVETDTEFMVGRVYDTTEGIIPGNY